VTQRTGVSRWSSYLFSSADSSDVPGKWTTTI